MSAGRGICWNGEGGGTGWYRWRPARSVVHWIGRGLLSLGDPSMVEINSWPASRITVTRTPAQGDAVTSSHLFVSLPMILIEYSQSPISRT